jgi:hypothetical protein
VRKPVSGGQLLELILPVLAYKRPSECTSGILVRGKAVLQFDELEMSRVQNDNSKSIVCSSIVFVVVVVVVIVVVVDTGGSRGCHGNLWYRTWKGLCITLG